MSQKIGNVGVLDLTKATEESIKDIEEVGNVGVVLYSQETAHLMSRMTMGNIGKSVEITKGFQLQQGVLTIDKNYLNAIQDPQKIFIMGVVIIKKDVEPQMLAKDKISLSGLGKVYAPENVYGQAGSVITDGLSVGTYEGAPPKVENGDFTLSNTYLDGQAEPLNLIVNGVLHLAADLDVEKFEDRVSMLEVHGVVSLPGEMEPSFYKKNPVVNGVVETIPAGYEHLKKAVRLNSRSIRRIKNKHVFTKKPIVLEKDITREVLGGAFTHIQSTSYVICPEHLEDLVYEITSLDTEVLTYENSFLLIKDDEIWSEDEFLAFEKPVNVIVDGQLTLDNDVTAETVMGKIASIDILGEVVVHEKKLKGSLQKLVRVNSGRMIEADKLESRDTVTLKNVGALSL